MDTVLLASWVRIRARKTRFLELGAATGAVSLMLALRFPSLRVTGLEIQRDLTLIAQQNRELNGVGDRVSFLQGDLRDVTLFSPQSFDGLAVNPPYESRKRGRVSPVASRAIARHGVEPQEGEGKETCSVEDVARAAARWLKGGGRLFAVFRADRLALFVGAMSTCSLTPKRLRMVHPAPGRPAKLFLIECAKDGGEGLIVEPPLVVYGDGGQYTPELLAVYDRAAGMR
ncbi:MAG: methyltransferase domain-containing protein [Synergistaceae bacterium]|nr:methyltransferase domain-containing protein [Synergistaceae bacterium]